MDYQLKNMSSVPETSGRSNALLQAQVNNRRANERAIIENPLAYFTNDELEEDVTNFASLYLPFIDPKKVLRGAHVAKDIRLYDEISRTPNPALEAELPVLLTPEEKRYLKRERDVLFSERGMRKVIITVSLAALLQGFVQSSFNGAALYRDQWGLEGYDDHWKLGAANASPWFFAALVGCPLSLPINYWFGRRGGMIIAAILTGASAIGCVFVHNWVELFGVRIIMGIGMGIKAVSTPILASETAVGFWRGTTILAWQLWVAFGIMMGFVFNLIFEQASRKTVSLGLVQGAPLIPSLALLIMATFFCPESPRYHLMKGPNYSPEKAFRILCQLRNTELQALRDMYTVYKSLEQENIGMNEESAANQSPGFRWAIIDFITQYKQLFQQRRLYNALISSGVVNLAQQLCGVNVLAFYSGELFSSAGAQREKAMAYSLGFGAINFFFALPAVRSIDTLGRRRWLLMTLPFMALFMLGGALSFSIESDSTRTGIVALFLFLFAVAYSPGLGPIPFTLASESFPLSHREAGTAWPISINLFFAGLLSMLYPSMTESLGDGGSLGLFAGLNVVAFILVFFLVEETKGRSLEELDLVFAVSKRRFISFQVREYLPWFIRRYAFNHDEPQPQLYQDMIWGPYRRQSEMILSPASKSGPAGPYYYPEDNYPDEANVGFPPGTAEMEADSVSIKKMPAEMPAEMPATPPPAAVQDYSAPTVRDYPEPNFK